MEDAADAIHVTLLRHGESDANRQGRWQGQGDSPLSPLGREQAARVGARLEKCRFDRVVASDLSRASATARATGHAFEQDAQFRELDVGRWEGLTREEVNASFPDELERLSRGEDVPLGGGETYASFVGRVEAALQRTCTQMEPGQRLLVVCHGGVIGALISIALGIRERGRWPISRVGNTALSELRWTPQTMQLSAFNDDLHLEGMPLSEPDLLESRHEVLVAAEELHASVRERLAAAAAYRLRDAVAAGLEGLSGFETTASGSAALEAWLRYAHQNYVGEVARCLAAAEQLTGWLASSLQLRVGADAPVALPRPGSWARLRGGEKPVLQRYNAGVV